MVDGGYRGLKHLDLWDIRNVTSVGWVPLIRALAHCPCLEHLKLNPISVDVNGARSDDAQNDGNYDALLDHVKSELCCLNGLVLGVLGVFDSRRFAAIADAIACNTSITNVEFIGDYFPDGACRSLAQAMLTNISLRAVCISSDIGEITDQGWAELALGLKQNTTLERLQIQYHFDGSLSAKAIEEIRALLEVNMTLVAEYESPVDDDDDDGAAIVEFYAKLNRLGRHALLTMESAPRERWVEAMIDADGDVSVLFYWLKKNPSILCDVELEIATKDSVVSDSAKRRRFE